LNDSSHTHTKQFVQVSDYILSGYFVFFTHFLFCRHDLAQTASIQRQNPLEQIVPVLHQCTNREKERQQIVFFKWQLTAHAVTCVAINL